MEVSLVKKEEVADGTMAFWFDKPEGFSFVPGQFCEFVLDGERDDDLGNRRDLTICSSPAEEKIMVATRMRDSGFKKNLKEMEEGDKIQIIGPQGSFTMQGDSAVFVAGGIGITPFLSMIRSYPSKNMTLFYSNKTPGQTAFLEELERYAEERDNVELYATVTDYEGEWEHYKDRWTAERMLKLVDKKSTFYIAGPPGMVFGARKDLADNGVEKVLTEDFTGY